MALLTAARDYLVTVLETAGVPRVTTDIRDVAPPCVLVDPPTIRSLNGDVAELDFPVCVMSAPPATANAVTSFLTRADLILTIEELLVISGTPQTYFVGQQELPTFTLTCRLTYQAD